MNGRIVNVGTVGHIDNEADVDGLKSGTIVDLHKVIIYEMTPLQEAVIAFDGPPPNRKQSRINRKQKARGF